MPGAFAKGTNHFAYSGSPANEDRAAEYNNGPYASIPEQALKGLASLEPADADAATVADTIVRVVDMPFGKRPFRTYIDPSQKGCEIVNGVADRVRGDVSSYWAGGSVAGAGEAAGCRLKRCDGRWTLRKGALTRALIKS